MVAIPGGSFIMGDDGSTESNEKPAHSVTVQPFMMSNYEVTQRQWKAVMGTNPSRFKDYCDTCPVENVSWNDIQVYIQKLNAKTGGKYRLPGEAEWEYAARAGGTGQWRFGDDETQLGKYAWYVVDVKDGNSEGKPHQVGTKLKNKFGLHDMYGNVWEWVEDCYHGNHNDAPTNGSAWAKGCGKEAKRVLRGGGWHSSAQGVRSAYRADYRPGWLSDSFGFRLALGATDPAGQ
jgi:formylglycine-generating enzyme required for sulfatase activity